MGSQPTAPRVLEYMEKRTGLTVYIGDMMEHLGMTRPQVQAAVYNLKAKGHPIKVIAQGNAWAWAPNSNKSAEEKATNGRRLFEELGVSKDGRIVLQDADTGALFAAVEL